MLIEIHMIQNHSPANLNRDDLGAPKTCVFGGVTRARISSQCLKRSIRRSPEFAVALEKDGGVRTRRLISMLAAAAVPGGDKSKLEQKLKLVKAAFDKGGLKVDEKNKDDPNSTDMLVFVPTSTVANMVDKVKAATSADSLCDALTEVFAGKPIVPDIALCGRMTEVSGGGKFGDVNFSVEAALSAAHAFSTHAVINEVDYYTAADDNPRGHGAGFVGEAMFNSACFYKHFAIEFDQLVKNLSKDAKTPTEEEVNLARTTIKCFLEGAAKANPSGKQHSFAAFNFPDAILVEVKTNNTPVSYANAFADPVNEKSERGLIGESVAKLASYANDLITGYGIEAKRFYFSPNNRIKLDDEADAVAPPIKGATANGDFNKFVNTVMEAVKAPAKEAK